MQKLIMPFKSQMMLCGYKNPNYKKYWKFDHYGVDISTIQGNAGTDHNIYASGDGEVISCGWDNSGGNVVIVKYPQVYNRAKHEYKDLIARYMHLKSINVKAGTKLSAGTIIGEEGKSATGDFHLHIEFDTDTKYPNYSPQVSSRDDSKTVAQGNILRHGIDSSVNPSDIFYIGRDQKIVAPTYNPAWLNQCDFNIPKLDNYSFYKVYKYIGEADSIEKAFEMGDFVERCER